MPTTQETIKAYSERYGIFFGNVISIKDISLSEISRLIREKGNESICLTDGDFEAFDLDLPRKKGQIEFHDEVQISYTHFLNCRIPRANFRSLYIMRSCFISCDLTGADFTGSKLYTVKFRDCEVDGMILKPQAGASMVQVTGSKLDNIIIDGEWSMPPNKFYDEPTLVDKT